MEIKTIYLQDNPSYERRNELKRVVYPEAYRRFNEISPEEERKKEIENQIRIETQEKVFFFLLIEVYV